MSVSPLQLLSFRTIQQLDQWQRKKKKNYKKKNPAPAGCLCLPSPNPLQLQPFLPQRVLRRHTSFKFTHMQILRCDLHFKVFNSPYLLGSEALLIIDLCASGNHISIFCVVFNDSNNSNMQKVVLWTISLIISSKHHSFLAAFFFSRAEIVFE